MIRRGENVVGVTLGEREFVRFVDFGAEASAASQDAVDALTREFRAVRKQALLSAAAEIERLRASCVGVNDYELGLATALEAVREMAKPKRRKGP